MNAVKPHYSGEPTSTGLWLAVGLVVLGWISVLLPGFAFPWVNNVFHLPIVLGYAHSIEGPHDAFTQSLDNFVSGFWLVLKPFTTEQNAFSVFFAAHLAARIAFLAGITAVARTLGSRPLTALALAAVCGIAPIFKGVSTVGHTETLATYLSHTGVAIQLLPITWWLMLRQRWVAAACLIGLLFNVNAFISIWSVVAALAAMWFDRARLDRPWRVLIGCGLGYLIFAAPTVWWTFEVVTRPSHPIPFREYLLYRYPYHTFVHVQWDAAIRYSGFLATLACVIPFCTAELGARGRILAGLLLGYAAVFVAGVPLPYVTGSRLLLNLYPLRIDAVINVAVAAVIVGWAGQLADQGRRALGLALVFSVLAGAMLPILWLCHVHWRDRRSAWVPLAIAGPFALACWVAGAPPMLGNGFLPLTLLFAAASVSAIRDQGPKVLLPLVAAWSLTLVMTAGKTGLAGAAVLTLLTALLAWSWPRWLAGLVNVATSPRGILAGVAAMGMGLTAYAAVRGTVERPDADYGPEQEAQLWFRTHTPPDTLFLPVDVTGFAVLSRRPAWVDAQAGAAVMWKPDFLDQWWPRMREVDACQSEACYIDLARRHGVTWIVASSNRFAAPQGARLRFANRQIRILEVDSGQWRNQAK
ncbi:hypothetical protein ACFOON_11665 [Novosphingobium piscinae]|uniref:Glycosyltransferase RgtA/B/C/D-like domain-containing protein n=1 Tax=Novosphingobium piscinae TaxID=1507448 RepID=A0A7X1FW94_9SPHN|nr:hypothetical protein [Novosphingobium piscinae]MBC2668125.1 hypothetical protein [Novosphingobium piscinae]